MFPNTISCSTFLHVHELRLPNACCYRLGPPYSHVLHFTTSGRPNAMITDSEHRYKHRD